MAIHEIMYDLDNLFNSIPAGSKVVLNDFPLSEVDTIKDMLMTTYSGNEIDTIPKCSCERTYGGFKKGYICLHCGTKVTSMFDSKDPVLWLRAIDGTPGFINPTFWVMLSKTISSKVDVLRWIGDTAYNPQTINKVDVIVKNIMEIDGFERSYTWLYKNLATVITVVSMVPKLRTGSKLETFKALYEMTNDMQNITSMYLPLLNKSLFVMENTTKGKFTNVSSSNALHDLAITYIHKSKSENKSQIERVMAKTTATAAATAYINVDEYLSGKPKIPRKHMYGTRSPFTARAVITPIAGPHCYTDIEIPWGIAVTLFRPHLLNALVNRFDFKYKDASNLLYAVVSKYNDMIYGILNTFIDEAPGLKGPAVIFQRNPSLLPGSILRLNISRFKDDVTDNTISISLLNAKLPNYDIDGDEMNLTLPVDAYVANGLNAFEPHYSLLDNNSPGKVSKLLNLTGPVTATISNSLHADRERLLKKEGR